jgi:hypothetical protein
MKLLQIAKLPRARVLTSGSMTKSTPQARRFIQNVSTCLSSNQHDVSFHRLCLLSHSLNEACFETGYFERIQGEFNG